MKYVYIPGYDPGVQERIPMDRSFCAQATKQRIRIGEHLWVEEVIKT
jgi:hypothetical protein